MLKKVFSSGCQGARPYLDAGIPQHLQRGPHVGLQLVLHPSEAQQLQLSLQALYHGSYFQSPIVDAQLGLAVSVLGIEGTPRTHMYTFHVCSTDELHWL